MNARTFYRTPIIFFSIHPLLFDAAAWVVFFNKTYEADILVFFFAISSFIFLSKKKKKENVYAVAVVGAASLMVGTIFNVPFCMTRTK